MKTDYYKLPGGENLAINALDSTRKIRRGVITSCQCIKCRKWKPTELFEFKKEIRRLSNICDTCRVQNPNKRNHHTHF